MKTVILGKLNRDNVVNYWNIEEKMILGQDLDELIEKYAIVENMQGYDLVKIVGFAYIDEDEEKHIAKNKITKSVIRIIDMGDDNN